MSPEALLGLALTLGASESIEYLEAEGQQELIESTVLPTVIVGATQPEFEALGFTFGEEVPGDPLFRAATLPEGWKREGSDHAMWSYVVDETGQQRVAIFYKAASYDRKAHMSLVTANG